MSKRLEEIKNQYSGSFIIHGKNTIVGDMVWLIEKLEKAIEMAEFYADKNNWKYTDSGGQFSWYSTIKDDDIWLNPEVDEGGGNDYAGKRAREFLKELE